MVHQPHLGTAFRQLVSSYSMQDDLCRKVNHIMVESVHNIQFDKILICISVIARAGVKFGKLSRVVVT